MSKDVDDMLRVVHEAFYELNAKTLGNVWYSLQFVMNEVLKCKGGNEYHLPHHNKNRLQAQGILSTCITTPERDIIEAWMHLYGREEDVQTNVVMETQVEVVDEDHKF